MLWSVNDVKKEKVDGIILTVAQSSFLKTHINDLRDMQNKPPILIDIPGLYDAAEATKAGLYQRTL